MIQSHQASIFPDDIIVATSSREQGSIWHPDRDERGAERIDAWLSSVGIDPRKSVGIQVTYGDDRSYADIIDITEPAGSAGLLTADGWRPGDAFATTTPGIGMLIPVADCNAVVCYDPVKKVLALAHIGWHSTVNNLASKVVQHMSVQYGSQPADILVYISPSIRRESYRFTHLDTTPDVSWHAEPYATKQSDGTYAIDLLQYNIDQLIGAGVLGSHIEIVDTDTATDDKYYSHFARHSEGQTDRTSGRFAVAVQIRA